MPLNQSYGAGGPRVASTTANLRTSLLAQAGSPDRTDALLVAGMPRHYAWFLQTGGVASVTVQPQFMIRASTLPGETDEWLDYGASFPLAVGVPTLWQNEWAATKIRFVASIPGGVVDATIECAIGAAAR
jgi:hypothetical protein